MLSLWLVATPAWARKTNQPLYEDPFDLAAGGASLTRASKEGRLFANPALMPYGGKFHRWAGLTLSVLANRESIDTARTLIGGGSDTSGESGEEGAGDEGGGGQTSEFVDKIFDNPVHAGWGLSLSWVTSRFGLAVFSRFEPDFRAREFGDSGFPEVNFTAESYHGVVFGAPIQTPWRWLSFGLTGKYVYAAEPDLSVELTDQEAIAELQQQDLAQDLTGHNTGVGFDAGMLVFLQGSWLDYSLAAKIDDLGGTALSGPSDSPTELKQVISAGTAVTLHTGADAIHLALDYRDINNAYGEDMFKKVYAGTKIVLRTYLGLAAGYYNGYPSFGAEVDLLLMRIAATSYTREFGDSPGVDPRRIYMMSLSLGL